MRTKCQPRLQRAVAVCLGPFLVFAAAAPVFAKPDTPPKDPVPVVAVAPKVETKQPQSAASPESLSLWEAAESPAKGCLFGSIPSVLLIGTGAISAVVGADILRQSQLIDPYNTNISFDFCDSFIGMGLFFLGGVLPISLGTIGMAFVPPSAATWLSLRDPKLDRLSRDEIIDAAILPFVSHLGQLGASFWGWSRTEIR